MAAKRKANVFHYTDDTSCSDDDCVVKQPVKRYRRNKFTASGRLSKSSERNVSSCDEISQTRERRAKCNSKNAIMARENRIKKKMYVHGLEKQIASLKDENKKMKLTLSSQIGYVKELETEVSYLKSVLANSKEIGTLIGAICNTTSLQVKTSLTSLSKPEPIIPRRPRPIARRPPPIALKTAWPFDKADDIEESMPTPNTSVSSMSPPHMDEDSPLVPPNVDMDSYFSDENDLPCVFDDVLLSPLISNDEFDDAFEGIYKDSTNSKLEHSMGMLPCVKNVENASLEHNYSAKITDDNPSSFGVCLHINNKRLSLEFCSKCNERAIANWDAVTN